MKVVSDILKNTLKQPTTQRKGRILVNGNYYEVYNVEYYADVYNDGNVIGNAIASQLDFDLPYMAKFDSFKYFDGVWTGSDYEFVDMGTFTVVDEKDEDEFNKHITSFDNLIKFNAPFEDKNDYPKTLFQELQNICNQAGVELENTSIVNGNFIVENNQFVAGENLKTVLKNICGVSGTYATIKNDKLVLQLQNKTNEVMNKGQHEPIEWKRKTYGINQVVLGLKDVGGEYVVKQDDEDIETNGVHKLVINDNYFAYTQEKRQQLINGLFEQVKGFGYIPYELKCEWLNYMDVGDTITIDGIETIVLRINGKSPKGLESEMSAPAVIDSAIEYVDNTNTLANQQRRTELWVDKQLGEIRGEVTKVETTVEDITTTTQTSTGGNNLYLEDALESNALEYHVDGKSEQDGEPTPDAPVEIKSIPSIRNLFDKDNEKKNYTLDDNGTIYYVNDRNTSDYIPVKGNTKYTANINISRYACYDSSKTKITSSVLQNTNFTTPTNTAYVRFSYNNSLSNIMLEEGSIPHPYVPYGAWAKVKVTGKNLFDYSKIVRDANIEASGLISKATANGNYTINLNYIEIKPNTTYILSSNVKRQWVYNFFDEKPEIGLIGSTRIVKTDFTQTFTTPSNAKYVVIREDVSYDGSLERNDNQEIQLEENPIQTEYEAYKEKEVLIDLNKPNLFDKNDVNMILNNFNINSTSGLVQSVTNNASVLIKVKPNTTYTVIKQAGTRFVVGSCPDLPIAGTQLNVFKANNVSSKITITTGENDNYLIAWVWYGKDDTTITKQDMLSSVIVYEGTSTTPYYEISSIGDTKDTLDIVNGQVVLNKHTFSFKEDGTNIIYSTGNRLAINIYKSITKKASNGSSIVPLYCNMEKQTTSNNTYLKRDGASIDVTGTFHLYSSQIADKTLEEVKELLSNNNLVVVVPLAEPQQITLPNANIPLFEGVNHISLVDDLETTTSIKYYRNTPIAQDYVVQQQLDETNSNLSNTDNKVSQAQSDINTTNTNLNNNYYNKEQVDSINSTTTQNITQIKNTMEQNITSTNASISKIQEEITNGVSKVTTTTGTFDENGLNISKSGQQMSSTLDWDGLEVVRDKGKATETEVLTVRSSGVETENLKVRTYFTIGDNTRVENYKGGTGFFYVGGAS